MVCLRRGGRLMVYLRKGGTVMGLEGERGVTIRVMV